MQVTLPDGAELDLPDGATGLDAARAIGPKLAEATAAVEVDGSLRDLRLPLTDGAHLRILRVGDEDALRVLRHSTAHVLAEAVKHLYPTAKIAIGPAIDDGFYYDFEFPDGPPGEADLERIEAEMRRILGRGAVPDRAQVDDARRGDRALPRGGRAVQDRARRGTRGGRGDHGVRAGRVRRPLPRSAPAGHQADPCVQADLARGCLLARRLAQQAS